MAEFKKGDVVQLKSGGPKMTVTNVGNYSEGMGMGPEDGVACVWFEPGKATKAHEKVFDSAVLQIAPSNVGVVGVRRG